MPICAAPWVVVSHLIRFFVLAYNFNTRQNLSSFRRLPNLKVFTGYCAGFHTTLMLFLVVIHTTRTLYFSHSSTYIEHEEVLQGCNMGGVFYLVLLEVVTRLMENRSCTLNFTARNLTLLDTTQQCLFPTLLSRAWSVLNEGNYR